MRVAFLLPVIHPDTDPWANIKQDERKACKKHAMEGEDARSVMDLQAFEEHLLRVLLLDAVPQGCVGGYLHSLCLCLNGLV
jgi:hypothetical protein